MSVRIQIVSKSFTENPGPDPPKASKSGQETSLLKGRKP